MGTENELTVRDGETVQDMALRVGKRADETWDAFRARRLVEDSTFRQDGGDDDNDGLGEPNAEQARAGMLKRKNAAPAAEDAEPNAAQAQKDMIMRKRGASITKPKKEPAGARTPPARPPTSASEAEAEGDDDEEESDDGLGKPDALGAQAAHAAKLKDSWKSKRPGK